MTKPHDTASTVAAEQGQVHVSGPNGVAYSMTPDAATETGDRLRASAGEARGQQVAREEDGEGDGGPAEATG